MKALVIYGMQPPSESEIGVLELIREALKTRGWEVETEQLCLDDTEEVGIIVAGDIEAITLSQQDFFLHFPNAVPVILRVSDGIDISCLRLSAAQQDSLICCDLPNVRPFLLFVHCNTPSPLRLLAFA